MKTSLGDKVARVLKMVMGMRNPRVAAAMSTFGFSQADLEEGWQLLQTVSRVKLDRHGPGENSDIINKLDAWENRWFPVAAATLERRHPAVHALLFKNLSQTAGPAVAVGVRTFVERYDEMVAGAGGFGAEGTIAKATLAARGITSEIVNEARALLDTIGKVQSASNVTTIEQDKEDFVKAEAALWAWYLEWSQIARVAITQRALLRQMGFISTRRVSVVDDGTHEDGDGEGDRDSDLDVNPTTGVIVIPNGAAHL